MIAILLCLPGSTIPKSTFLQAIHADKWVHILLFFTGTFLLAWPVLRSGLPQGKKTAWFCLVTALGILFGISMEFVQEYWVINRSFELADIFADSAGCVLALAVAVARGRGKKIGPDRNRDRNQN
jgi:VanZ family protein